MLQNLLLLIPRCGKLEPFFNDKLLQPSFYFAVAYPDGAIAGVLVSEAGNHIQSTLFSSQLTNGPNKLECLYVPA